MIRIKIVIFIALFIPFILPANVQAEPQKGDITLYPHAGVHVFDSSQDIEDDRVYGLGLGYNFTDKLSSELSFRFGQFVHNYYDSERGDCCCENTEAQFLQLDALYQPWTDNPFVPYVAAGVGGVRIGYKHKDTETYPTFNYGGGFKYYFSKNAAFRGDVRHILPGNSADNNLACTAGLVFEFGGEKKKTASEKSGGKRPQIELSENSGQENRQKPSEPFPKDKKRCYLPIIQITEGWKEDIKGYRLNL